MVLLDTRTPGSSLEIFSEDANDGMRTRDGTSRIGLHGSAPPVPGCISTNQLQQVFQIEVYNFRTTFLTSEDLNEANIVFIAFLKRVQIV